jgi:hypothetical protein
VIASSAVQPLLACELEAEAVAVEETLGVTTSVDGECQCQWAIRLYAA